MMRQTFTTHAFTALLILLYVYTACSKLIDFNAFRLQMRMQVLPPLIQDVAIWSLPALELLTAGLLLWNRSKLSGLYLSLGLLVSFTGYVLLVVLRVFNRVPCSCGGVIRYFTWGQHLVFNLFFLLLNLLAIGLTNRERRAMTTKERLL